MKTIIVPSYPVLLEKGQRVRQLLRFTEAKGTGVPCVSTPDQRAAKLVKVLKVLMFDSLLPDHPAERNL